MKKFAVFDIDGTLIRWQLYHAIADEFVKLGYIKPERYQGVKEARMEWKRRSGKGGFRSYEKVLIETYESILKDLTLQQFMTAAESVFDEYKDQVYVYPRDLTSSLKKRGYLLFAISGSQIEIVEKIASYYSFDEWVGTVYQYKDGRYTGQKNIGSHDKAATLKQMIRRHDVTMRGSIAIGDSKSDIAMLELVEQPIAFNPEAELFSHAKNSSWKVVIERKNMVYELEPRNGKYQLVKTIVR